MELMHQEAAISRGEDLLEEEEELANHNKQIRFQDEAPPRKPLHHLMDLSLGNSNEQDDVVLANSATTSGGNNAAAVDPAVEKEHMFDKVVTPSDVGKLNRLVIPKQHAERYFPLDASTNDKGLLLNFEDRGGKLWRFRYSYWNSSQSYVMTKGWSRFVKEKKLDAGDIVSFHRGLGEMYRHRLYIDWRRQPDHVPVPNNYHHPVPASSLISPFFVPNQYTIRWGGGGDGSSGRMYSVPTVAPPAPMNYNNYGFQEPQLLLQHQHQYQQQQQRQYQQVYGGNGYNVNNEMNLGSGSLYYLRSTAPGQRDGGSDMAPMIIDSVPVAHGMSSGSGSGSNNAGKTLRLFGVNMECSSPPSSSSNYIANSSLPSRNPRESNEEQEEELEEYEDEPIGSSPSSGSRFGDEIPKGETSVLFDLNPSSFHQYRR